MSYLQKLCWSLHFWKQVFFKPSFQIFRMVGIAVVFLLLFPSQLNCEQDDQVVSYNLKFTTYNWIASRALGPRRRSPPSEWEVRLQVGRKRDNKEKNHNVSFCAYVQLREISPKPKSDKIRAPLSSTRCPTSCHARVRASCVDFI